MNTVEYRETISVAQKHITVSAVSIYIFPEWMDMARVSFLGKHNNVAVFLQPLFLQNMRCSFLPVATNAMEEALLIIIGGILLCTWSSDSCDVFLLVYANLVLEYYKKYMCEAVHVV